MFVCVFVLLFVEVVVEHVYYNVRYVGSDVVTSLNDCTKIEACDKLGLLQDMEAIYFLLVSSFSSSSFSLFLSLLALRNIIRSL